MTNPVMTMLFLFFLAIFGTGVSNPLSEQFQLVGSLKVSDPIFVFMFYVSVLNPRFWSTFTKVINCSPYITFLLFGLFIFVVLSVGANLENSSQRSIEHFARIIYYFCMVFLLSYISLFYFPPMVVLKGLYMGIVATCLVGIVFVFFLDKGLAYGNGIYKLDSTLGANPTATYVAVLFPIGLTLLERSPRLLSKVFYTMSLVLLIAVALISEAKGAWVSMFVVGSIFFLTLKSTRKKILSIILLVVFLVPVFDSVFWIINQELTTTSANTAQRVFMYREAWNIFSDSPFFGVGYSNYLSVSPRGYDPHSSYATIFAETGVVGGSLYLFLLLFLTIDLWTNRDDDVCHLLFLLFVSVSIMGFFTGLILSQILIYIFIGLYLAQKLRIRWENAN